jgi:uncharacterized membrane protein YagU involved in acid resistance
MSQPKLYRSIIKAGLIAGTLDISAAFISTFIRSGKSPDAVLKFIANAAFGREAFETDNQTIIAGLLLHYLIAFSFTIDFFLIYPLLKKWLSSYIIISGLVYGVIVWCIMNLLIMPMSKVPVATPPVSQVIIGMSFLMFLIGLPVAIFAKKHYAIQLQQEHENK